METIKTQKVYIDYLDHAMSFRTCAIPPETRLRFDLLLFAEDTLCLSVPACVKLGSTTDLLMKLTPFWDAERIKLILDKKHRKNPWNYFNNRMRVLENGFPEETLLSHFEFTAYQSPRTKDFYNVYLKEVLKNGSGHYIGKIEDTDEAFRKAVISQASELIETVSPHFDITLDEKLHMGRVFSDLIGIAENHNSLFQRSAVEEALTNTYGATATELKMVRRMLDNGFSYANGVSGHAAPLSQITNRLTSKTFIPIIKAADEEFYNMICNLSWKALFMFSLNPSWLDLLDHLNRLLLVYRDSHKAGDRSLLPTNLIHHSNSTITLVNALYNAAVESLQNMLMQNGIVSFNIINARDYCETLFEYYIRHKHEYWSLIQNINILLQALKTNITSMGRRYKDTTILLVRNGYKVVIDPDF